MTGSTDLISKINGGFSPKLLLKFDSEILEALPNILQSNWFYRLGLMRHGILFMAQYLSSLRSFAQMRTRDSSRTPSYAMARAFWDLLLLDVEITTRGALSGLNAMNIYHMRQMSEVLTAIFNSLFDAGQENIVEYSKRQLQLMDVVVNTYPKAVRDIVSEYGFHFDNGGYVKVAQTDRF